MKRFEREFKEKGETTVKLLFLIPIVLLCACGVGLTDSKTPVTSASTQTSSSNDLKETAKPRNADNSVSYFDEICTDSDLSYGEYRVEKCSKTIWLKEDKVDAEVTYAVLKRNGKIVATFEGIHYPLGNDTCFALFPLLGQKTQQLIIEQQAHRMWHYWVVNLIPNSKVIYDSGQYPVGHSLRAVDINQDGVYELIQNSHTFWFWERLTNVDSLLPEIIFAYDPPLQKYVPANPQFQEFALRNIEDDIRKAKKVTSQSGIQSEDKLGAVLNVVLNYIYAGKEQEAWAFYENEYNLPDKEETKARIQKELNNDRVYKVLDKQRNLEAFEIF